MLFKKRSVLKNKGYCPICQSKVVFESKETWLRDYYLCSKCRSIPRERALMHVIQTYYPDWPKLTIHESSPLYQGATLKMIQECRNFIMSQYYPGRERGSIVEDFRCEDLEDLTFDDESIDLQITQDVMEHLFHPARAFSEIARVLKPGGAHIFTVPLINKTRPSELRAKLDTDGNVVHLKPPQYHGNPVSDEGSLVTVDWGFDICQYIFKASGLYTHVVTMDDISKGIRAEFIEVLITFKPDNSIPESPSP